MFGAIHDGLDEGDAFQGDTRKSKMDDNATSVRKWEDDTPEAEEFWQTRIETLSEDERVQVEKFLPSINAI